MSHATKKFLMKFNGWLGFAVATLLFFAAPPLYRMIDPTAGQFDAGYIHPIIYASCVVSFAIGIAFLSLFITAPGIYKSLDKFFESESYLVTDQVKYGFVFIIVIIVSTVVVVCSVI